MKSKIMVAVGAFALCTGSVSWAAGVDAAAAEALMKKSGCGKCHSVSAKKEGPAYKETAAKLKGKAGAEDELFKHLTTNPKVKVEHTASGQKIFRITEGIVVEGKIQKPNAFYVLQRSSMDYDWESLKQDFLPKILQAASHHPF